MIRVSRPSREGDPAPQFHTVTPNGAGRRGSRCGASIPAQSTGLRPWGVILALTLTFATPSGAIAGIQPALVVRDAAAIRALGIESPGRILPLLNRMPPGLLPRDGKSVKPRLALWSLFFKGSMIELGRLSSADPLIFYFNPLEDVGLVMGCPYDTKTGKPNCIEACTFPGELLRNETPRRDPSWVQAKDPFVALEENSDLQLTAFAANEPVTAAAADSWKGTYCSTRLQSMAEVRLLDAAQRFARLNPKALKAAVARYLENYRPHALKAKAARSDPPVNGDLTFKILFKLSKFSLSGAWRVAHHEWLLFLTPRHSGWGDATLLLKQGQKGTLSVIGSRLFVFSTHSS